jgi:hypothetical protein
MIYRALTDLNTGKKIITRGSLFPSGVLGTEAEKMLLEMDKIAIVSAPPLTEFSFLSARAVEKLVAHDIIRVDQFLEAGDDELAKILHRGGAYIQEMKNRLAEVLSVKHAEG